MDEISASDLKTLEKGDIIDFHDAYLVTGFPIPNFNILSEGPFTVKKRFKYSDSWEYLVESIEGRNAYVEYEEEDGEPEILIDIRLDKKFPHISHELLSTSKRDVSKFTLNSVTYYLDENDDDTDEDGEEYEYWDFYSGPIPGSEDQRLFIGIEDYGDPGKPKYEVFAGFTLPARAIKDIIKRR